MKIHEYQGKEILRRYGVTVPLGVVCRSIEEVSHLAPTIMGPPWVVKAQIHAGVGGRGAELKLCHHSRVCIRLPMRCWV